MTLELHAAALATAPLPADPVAIIDELRALEELKCAAEARQARLSAALDKIRSEKDAAVHAEIALARRVSPHRGRRLLSLARFFDSEMPLTKAAFDTGQISEWRATIIARETACLAAEHRALVDESIAADPVALSGRGDRELTALIGRFAARLDAASVARRRQRAESERRVTLRPAADAMVYLTALLPVVQGVAVYAALRADAVTKVGTGQATSIGNAMADGLVSRVTGGHTAAQPVALRLTMSADALFDKAEEPAHLADYGPIPAEAARALLADNLDAGAKVWLKCLFTHPETGDLISMDSRARRFPPALAEFIDLRDQWCRAPWCDAPIRHHDHVKAHADGGPTSGVNGQGLCESCNLTKEARGWLTRRRPGPGHIINTQTPTGHRYRSRDPAA